MKKKQKKQQQTNPTKVEQKRVIRQEQTYLGPIPPPSALEHYQHIDKALPNRIVVMAENEAAHRHKVEQQELDINIQLNLERMIERRRGQWFGLVIGLVGLSVSGYMAHIGAVYSASVVGGATVVSLVGLFVAGKFLSDK